MDVGKNTTHIDCLQRAGEIIIVLVIVVSISLGTLLVLFLLCLSDIGPSRPRLRKEENLANTLEVGQSEGPEPRPRRSSPEVTSIIAEVHTSPI